MRMNWRLIVATLVGITLVVGLSEASVGGAGRGGKSVTRFLQGQTSSGGNLVRLSCRLDPVLFALTSVADRYKVLRIDIENMGGTPLVLSPDKDHLEAEVLGQKAPAILNLSAKDPALWDSLTDSLRKALVYPRVVEAGESGTVLVYLEIGSKDPRLNKLGSMKLSYTIDSLAKTPVILEERVTAA